MDIVLGTFGQPFTNWCRSFTDVVTNLESNTETLEECNRELFARVQDVKRSLSEMKIRDSRNLVRNWIKEAHLAIKTADIAIIKARRSENWCSRYRRGGKVILLTKKLNLLFEKGHFDELFVDWTPACDRLPMKRGTIVSAAFKESINAVMKKGDSLIGLVGEKGIGKTCFISYLTNRVMGHFDYVLVVDMAEAAEESLESSIQQQIGVKLRLSEDPLWKDSTAKGRSALIYRALRGVRYLIVVEDLTENIDLSSIGIGFLKANMKNRNKLLFTTKDTRICGIMEVDATIELKGLNKEESVNLLAHSAKLQLLDENIKILNDPAATDELKEKNREYNDIIREIALMCHGNPIVLKSIGNALIGCNKEELQKELKDYMEAAKAKGGVGAWEFYHNLCGTQGSRLYMGNSPNLIDLAYQTPNLPKDRNKSKSI